MINTVFSSSLIKFFNIQIAKNIEIVKINKEIKNNKSLRLSLVKTVFKFRPNISKKSLGKLDPKKALITVLYIKLIDSYFVKSNIIALLADPISSTEFEININDN